MQGLSTDHTMNVKPVTGPQGHGLTDAEVLNNRKQYGSNTLNLPGDRLFLKVVQGIVTEPMFLILLAACIIYFLVGQYQEGIIMLVSIFIVAGISLFQEYRSKNAIHALNKLSAPHARVLRNGKTTYIETAEIVIGDIVLIQEGDLVPADGIIATGNDLSLNESLLTGESFPVRKTADGEAVVYSGTLVTSGSAAFKVSAVGKETRLGKIGLSLSEINLVKTPLQKQVRSFVRNMVWIGAASFLIVVGFHAYQSGDFIQSFLQGLTLAMSILPEEIPVAFSTFQALGAFRLLKHKIIVKQPQYVETLGSATVICADKTGTLTQNKMQIDYVYDAGTDTSYLVNGISKLPADVIEYAMWSSETDPFDAMEKAIHSLYAGSTVVDKRNLFSQVHEYPVGGKPPMMTHVFKNAADEVVIAVKGAAEGIIRQASLTEQQQERISKQVLEYAALGYRVLGIGKGKWEGTDWPESQEAFPFEFLGLIAFQDPPKENMIETIRVFKDAGINVKMITGDYAATALAIAGQVQLVHGKELLTGEEVMELSGEALQQKVKTVDIFARMFPEAKLKVVNALIKNEEVVAMTGDGVNDAPALKAAHIGIAMGLRGSEVAKNAASLVLVDDDLSHMTEAVALGRKIYDNLKKAIQYIVSIHIPIILIVMLPLLLGWAFTDIFSPVHVIFLELIMGPTCSIIYENEPAEPGTMKRPPKKHGSNFLSFHQLLVSIIQGIVIATGCLLLGYYFLQQGMEHAGVRSIIFITLLFCNIFLTLVNRSFYFSIFETIRYKNYLVPLIISITLLLMLALLYAPFARNLFQLQQLPLSIIGLSAAVAVASTLWMELFKLYRRVRANMAAEVQAK